MNTARVKDQELIEGIASIPWQGRAVHICFDSDASENDKVRWAEWHLAETLTRHGAAVKIVRLPAGQQDLAGGFAKVGLDDFLVQHGPDAFRSLLAAATTPESPDKEPKPAEALDDPHRLARSYLEQQAHPDRPRVLFFREQFWKWTGTNWIARPDAEMRGELARFCKQQLDKDTAALAAALEAASNDDAKNVPLKVPKVTTALIANVMQALSGAVLLPAETPQPAWLGAGSEQRNFLALRNGLLDVDALLRGEPDHLLAHTPFWFSPVCLPFDFDATADCPKWKAFLDRNLEGRDNSKSRLLQQFAGYLLVFDTSKQRFLLLVGEGANGKSVVCAVLRALLGENNTSAVPLELFGDKFRLAGTLGKLANIVAEVGEMDRVAEGQLKAFVTGDPMEFERKFKTPFMARPTARLVLATNNPPSFSDKSDGLWRRMLLLRFGVQIPTAERVAGMDSVEWWADAGELPGILNWALAGLHLLRTQGRFVVPPDCQEDVDRMRVEANPARRFLEEHYQTGCGELSTASVYETYRDWCNKNGHHSLAEVGLGKEVTRRFPSVKRGKMTTPMGRANAYKGLEIRSE